MTVKTHTPSSEEKPVKMREAWPHVSVCVVLVVLFAATAYTSWDLGVGGFSSPEAGLWPMLASLLGLGLSIALLVSVLAGIIDRAAELFDDVHWLRALVFVVAIVGFLVFYPVVGFLLAAVPMTFVLLKYAAEANWLPTIIMSVVGPIALYILFREVLNVRF